MRFLQWAIKSILALLQSFVFGHPCTIGWLNLVHDFNLNFLTDMKDELVFYRLDELADHVEVRIDEKRETIWLTQQQIADLFGTKRPAITKHLSTIFYSGELDEEVVCSILEHTTLHGALRQKTQKTRVKYYSLDAVLAVGYRVNSGRATQFRIWVTRILKDYLLKGYVINNRMNRLEDRMEAIDTQINHLELQLNTHLITTQGVFFEG
jgi:prophage antirepressor-like protein